MSKTDLARRAGDALDSMGRWPWLRCDPDGNPFRPGMALSDATNRLALEGHDSPEELLLHGLCTEALIARGSISWRQYKNYQHYQVQEHNALIPALRWKKLAGLIAESRKKTGPGSWIEETISLPELGMAECARYSWNAQSDWFDTCEKGDAWEPWDANYFEEWFSATSLEIVPSDLGTAQSLAENAADHPDSGKRAGGRRPANWWPDFAEELAVYIHERGLPAGKGTEGQDEMISDIFRRMNEQGRSEGGRTTVQPVIRSVLLRLRQADN